MTQYLFFSNSWRIPLPFSKSRTVDNIKMKLSRILTIVTWNNLLMTFFWTCNAACILDKKTRQIITKTLDTKFSQYCNNHFLDKINLPCGGLATNLCRNHFCTFHSCYQNFSLGQFFSFEISFESENMWIINNLRKVAQ